MKPRVTLYVVVHGPIFERYAADLLASAREFFCRSWCPELVTLPTPHTEWPWSSARRYGVALANRKLLRGDYIFQVDADSRFEHPVSLAEIMADGLVVTTHPGFADADPARFPYCRDPRSSAYVPPGGEGKTYHPGAFVGGERGAFLEMCSVVDARIVADQERKIRAVWYEESHLNRYLIDTPPALILPQRFCYWDYWGPAEGDKRTLVHLDKTPAEFAERGGSPYA